MKFMKIQKMNIIKIDKNNIKNNNVVKLFKNEIKFENFKFNDDIYLGIRPEDISLKHDGEIKLDIKIDLIENLGFEKIIYSSISNKEIRIKTSENISKETNKISFSKSKVFLFDKNKNRIR